MKILLLNGSPRNGGRLSQILRIIEESAKRNDEVRSYTVSNLAFKSCIGCMACRKNRLCVLQKDDAHKIAEEIRTCDAVVVGTPVYWGNMNGDLKRLFDRLVGILMAETKLGIPKPLHEGKKAYIVVTCTTPFPFNILAGQSTKAVAAVKEVLAASGFKLKGKIVLPGTKGMEILPQKIERKAATLI
ncbi:flavodoxin family protein [Treponema brennaborense]|uniref:NADPH-dependent FMN reductase n=1 Tax=Treponema brennaborense (strain DSM 12168 / CIP 105900 / DD5/3) TaxID=906968 RepID=F4LMR4_TREBD|nr:flavodoxin family protein [Treponema brennaborense]AEE17804.1 NADPH-dependent FMN reductase [Treponema brennaborense DSM 12168]